MRRVFAVLCVSSFLCAGLVLSRRVSADDIGERAKKLHFSSIILDTHDDTTQRFFTKDYDIGKRNPDGHVDIPRMLEGGHMIGNDIRVLRMFGDLGVRYMTLSHFYNDEWADSSTDKPVHNGLTD